VHCQQESRPGSREKCANLGALPFDFSGILKLSIGIEIAYSYGEVIIVWMEFDDGDFSRMPREAVITDGAPTRPCPSNYHHLRIIAPHVQRLAPHTMLHYSMSTSSRMFCVRCVCPPRQRIRRVYARSLHSATQSADDMFAVGPLPGVTALWHTCRVT
jgi:hypothetical protein